MEAIVDPSECLKDSPHFRLILEKNETDIDLFEKTIAEVLKQCSMMIETGKQFIRVKNNFISSLVNLSVCFAEDLLMSKCITRFISTFHEISKYDTIFNEQINRTINENLSTFLHDDIGTVKELKRRFEKRSDDLDLVYTKYSQVPKGKQTEWEEANNMLTATRSCFQHLTLDYVAQLSILTSRRRHVILDSLLSLANSYGTYFHQGYDYFEDIKDFNNDIGNNLVEMRSNSTKLEKSLNNRHHLVSQNEIIPSMIRNGDTIRLEGYLFKRTSNTFKSWNRRWFILQNHKLVYRKRSNEKEVTVMENDLRLCNARPVNETDRRFCFEVVSPTKSHILQADSEDACIQWLAALHAGINAAFNSSRESVSSAGDIKRNSSSYLDVSSIDSLSTNTSSSTNQSLSNLNSSTNTTTIFTNSNANSSNNNYSNCLPKSDLSKILSVAGNDKCADCGCSEPIWASINLGITLCIECSGVHRSMGVHVSKVRSLKLDHWDCEQVNVMLGLGNAALNQIYEAKWPIISHNSIEDVTSDSSIENHNLNVSHAPSTSNSEFYVDQLNCDEKEDKDKNTPLLSINNNSTNISRTQSPTRYERIHSKSARPERERWIRAKYIDKIFVDKSVNLQISLNYSSQDSEQSPPADKESCPSDHHITKSVSFQTLHSKVVQQMSSPQFLEMMTFENDNLIDHYYNLILYEAAAICDLKVMAMTLAANASVNWQNKLDNNRTVLYQAISSGTMTSCEYLLLNGAKCNLKDDQGCTALHHATRQANTGQVCLLLKRGADLSSLNLAEEDALSIAVNNANADIVTLLRLKKLKDEMRNEEMGNQNDDTFNEVLRDFSRVQIIAETSRDRSGQNINININNT